MHTSPPTQPDHSVMKACTFLSTAFGQLPSESVSKGLEPRERSPQKDPVPATRQGGPKAPSLPFLTRGSTSTPASPNRPLVEDQPSSASSLNKLSMPMEYGHTPPLHSSDSSLQDAQRPFSPSQDEATLHTPPLSEEQSQQTRVQMPSSDQLQAIHVVQSREALKRAPIASISPQEVVDFTDSLFQEVHPTLVDQLPPPQLASLQCSFRYMDQSLSELSERMEDSQQSHTDTIKENALSQALCQEANLVTLERANTHETLKVRDEASHVKVLSQNIQRNLNELTASLHPSSRILHQIQAAATGLADQQSTFTKNMEYYMYKIGVKFETHPSRKPQVPPLLLHHPRVTGPHDLWKTIRKLSNLRRMYLNRPGTLP